MSRFKLGQLLATPGVLEAAAGEDLRPYLTRHPAGDWGIVDAADQQANERALGEGTRVLSAYTLANGAIPEKNGCRGITSDSRVLDSAV